MDPNDPNTDASQSAPDAGSADANGAAAQASTPNRLDLLLDVPLNLSVELGRSRMSIEKVLGLQGGSILELDKVAGEPLDILLNGKLVAKGEAVVVGEKFGVRITQIVSPTERLARLG
jgi:flagellar motor switch protein FliN